MPKLVWSKTGDEISLVPCNNELYEYFVTNLVLSNTNYYYGPRIDHDDLFDQLTESVVILNRILTTKFKITVFDIADPNWYDQKLLNQLHSNWVKLYHTHKNISVLCDNIEPGASDHFYRLNKLIHTIERSFDTLLLVNNNTCFKNIFNGDLTMHGVAGLTINYHNLGRSSWNKWINFDNSQDDSDTNDFKEIYTELTLSLARPWTYNIPREFNQTSPRSDRIGLANFDRLEDNLLNYRQLIYKNFNLESNSFQLH